MQKKATNRMQKVDEEFKRELSKIIDQDLKNPNITGLISVMKVKTSPDLKNAKIMNFKRKKGDRHHIKEKTEKNMMLVNTYFI